MNKPNVVEFKGSVGEESVEPAFFKAIVHCLDNIYEAGQVKGLVESYIMWKYRDDWKEMTQGE